MANDWYCQIDQSIYGPLASHELKRMAETGKLKPANLVKKTETGKWVSATQVKGLTFQDLTEAVEKPPDSDSHVGKPASSSKPSRQCASGPASPVRYFECSTPPGNATCSDDSCPCGSPGTTIPQGTGYLYISAEVVEFRRDALAESAAAAKIQDIQRTLKARVANPNVLASPILMCRLGGVKRGIDLDVASRDAQHWWKTGQVPLRPTPTVGQGAAADTTGEAVSKELRHTPHTRINQEHYEKMRRVLDDTSKEITHLLSMLPPEARKGKSGPHQSEFLAASLPLACRFFYDKEFPKEEGFGLSTILDFSNTDLSEGVFASMMFDRQFDHVRFTDANLDKTFWAIVHMKDADFSGASLRECTISNLDCTGCCFKDANLSGAYIKGLKIVEGSPVNFTGANFSGAKIELIDPVQMILTGAVMTECRVSTGPKTTRQQKKKSLRAFLQCLSEAQRAQIILNESDKQLVESADFTSPDKPWWKFW